MKTKITLIGIMAFALMMATGCRTVTNADGSTTQQLDPQRTANVIRAIVPPAVKIAEAQKPEVKKYLIDVQVVTCALTSSTNVSPASLKAAVESTGIKEIETPEIEATIQSIYAIYSAYYGDVVAQKLPAQEWCVPVLKAICDGVTEGLSE